MNMGKRLSLALLLLASLLTSPGCGRGGPKTYAVKGRIDFRGSNPTELAGNHIEASLDSDPTVRASGEIQQDGSFTLATLRNGAVLRGALEGSYSVRLVLADDDGAALQRATERIPQHFLDFKRSGWTIKVPADEEVVLLVATP